MPDLNQIQGTLGIPYVSFHWVTPYVFNNIICKLQKFKLLTKLICSAKGNGSSIYEFCNSSVLENKIYSYWWEDKYT